MFSLYAWLSVLGSTSVVGVGALALGTQSPPWRVGTAAGLVLLYGSVLILRPGGVFVGDAALLFGAVGAATLIAFGVRSTVALATFCIVAAVSDVASFSGGFTRHVSDAYQAGESDLLRFLAFTIPYGGRLRPIVGVGDLIVAGTVAAALAGSGHAASRAILVPAVGLVTALFIALIVGGISAIPFIAATTLAYLAWCRQGTRSR
jgi:hypothetical protein